MADAWSIGRTFATTGCGRLIDDASHPARRTRHPPRPHRGRPTAPARDPHAAGRHRMVARLRHGPASRRRVRDRQTPPRSRSSSMARSSASSCTPSRATRTTSRRASTSRSTSPAWGRVLAATRCARSHATSSKSAVITGSASTPRSPTSARSPSYKRVGFKRVGVMRQYEKGADGTFHDNLLLDMLVGELT